MITHKFYGWLVGNVRVRAQSKFPEKLVNILVSNGISMWDIAVGNNWLEFSTDVFSYKRCWGLHHKTGSSLAVLHRGGIYIWLRTLRRRKLLIAGFFCFWLLLFGLSSFVWTLEFEGMETIDLQELEHVVEEHGLSQGALIRRLDFDDIEADLYVKFPQIAWTAIERSGTYVKITIVEKEPDPNIDTPIDIVAAYDGIISSIMVLQGRQLVEPGMTVVAGDVLIAGYKDGADIVHAAGSIKAIVYLEGYGECGLMETEFKPTGNTKVQRFLNLGQRRILIYGRKPAYKQFRVSETGRDSRWNNILPIRLIERTYSEVEEISREYSQEQARQLAEERALISLHLLTYTDADLLSKEIQDITFVNENIVRIRVQLELEANIGTEVGPVKEDND